MTSKKNNYFSDISLKYKIWLQSDKGYIILGDGRYKLLKAIEKTGSLSSAAKEVKISYRKAWDILKKSENNLGFLIVNKKRGGQHGGQTLLTKEGKKLLNAYEKLQTDLNEKINIAFEDFLNEIR